MRFLSFLSAFVLALASCRRTPESGGTVIDVPGKFACFHRKMAVEVWDAGSDRLNYTVGRARVKVGPSQPALERAANWMIYPESLDKVWVFDGEKDVTRIEFNADGGSKFTSSQVVPGLLAEVPPEMAQRLPDEMQTK